MKHLTSGRQILGFFAGHGAILRSLADAARVPRGAAWRSGARRGAQGQVGWFIFFVDKYIC